MPLLDLFWTMLWLALLFAWFWLLIMVATDVIRSDDLPGWAKAAWVFFTIFLPYLGVFIYLVARGGSMWERNARDKAAWKEMTQGPDREAADSPVMVEELAKLADLRDRGVLTAAEYDQQKALLLG
jgi:Short C-terminal domain/Phospholipase_D-nuclease N-terminal